MAIVLPNRRARRARPILAALALPLASLSLAALAHSARAAPVAAALRDDVEAFRTMRVGIVVHEGVEVLDFAGPAEVFDAAGKTLRIEDLPWFDVVTVAPSIEPVLAHGGVTVVPRFTIADCPQLDVLVVPGGATQVLTQDAAFIDWLREQSKRTKVTMSVCTGAFALLDAGLLEGREATTHHGGALEGLRRQAKSTRVLANRRVVDSGPVVTAAGVAAGIDGALHVVARMLGRRHAEEVARYMEYRWQPEPQLEGSYDDWATIAGEQARGLQQIAAHRRVSDWKEVEAIARELVDADPDDGSAWYELGLALHQQGQLEESIAAHEEAAKFAVRRAAALYNLACARALKGEADAAFDVLGRAIDAGWRRRGTTEADADLASLHGDARFAAALARMGAAPPPSRPAWATSILERAREAVVAGRVEVALRALTDAAGGSQPPDDEVLGELQLALARRDAVPSEGTWLARRALAARPWPGRIVLAPADEPGPRMVVSGVVRDRRGRPLAGARLHVFHADASGHYRPEKPMDERNARLNGWIVTGDDGAYEIESVRPGGYPQPRKDMPADAGDARFIPQHVHFEVTAPSRGIRRFQLVFADDPRMTPHWHEWAEDEGNPVIELVPDNTGVLRGVCDITLE